MNWTPKSQVIVQGIKEPLGLLYAQRMKTYGTNIVAGISAGQGNEQINDIPVFNLVEEAIAQVGEVETTLIFVKPYAVLDAALEAIASGIKQIIIISRGVPPLDLVRLLKKAKTTNTLVLGSGSTGIIIPEKIWLGIGETQFYRPGNIGLISRIDSISYEVALELNQAELGQSFIVSIGNGDIVGSTFEYWLQILEEDENTEAIVLIGNLGSTMEGNAANYIAENIQKPVIVYLPGIYSPLEISFEDAGTIIANQLSYSVLAKSKDKQILTAFKKAKVPVAQSPFQIPQLITKALEKQIS